MRARKAPGFWRKAVNRSEYIEGIYHNKGFNSLEQLNTLTFADYQSSGGNALLTNYNWNIRKLLQETYPNYPWSFEGRRSRNYWQLIDNRRKFIENLTTKLSVSPNNNWKLSLETLRMYGGGGLISYYQSNVKRMMEELSPEQMKQSNFHKFKDYWNSLENQRKFMDELYERLEMKSINDWQYLNKSQLKQHGGNAILKLYQSDLLLLFNSIYPEHSSIWKEFFNDDAKVLYLIRKFKIEKKEDWFRISYLDYPNLFPLLSRKFPSLFSRSDRLMLPSYYYLTQKEKSDNNSNNNNSNNNNNNNNNDKVDSIVNNVNKSNQINTKRNKKKEIKIKKLSTQRWLLICLKTIYPNHLLLENYKTTELFNNLPLFEFDIFIPALNIAYEYQGEQHYNEIPAKFQNVESYSSRDEKKAQLCQEFQIQLFFIPFWWDRSPSSLISYSNKHNSS